MGDIEQPISDQIDIDPDPFSSFLAIMGALGGLSAIVSAICDVINSSRREPYDLRLWGRERERADKTRRELGGLLLTLETLLNDVESSLLNLFELLEISESDLQRQNFEFGGLRPSYSLEQFKVYAKVYMTIHQKCINVHKAITSITVLLYNFPGHKEDIDEVTHQVKSFREKLNSFLCGEFRPNNYADAFHICKEVISDGKALIQKTAQLFIR